MKLDTVIDDIVESYQTHNEISKVDAIRQPDKAVIIDLLERLQDIIFPGFFGRKGLKSDYVKYYLGDQIQFYLLLIIVKTAKTLVRKKKHGIKHLPS